MPRDLTDAEIAANIDECFDHGYAAWNEARGSHMTQHGSDIFWALATLLTDHEAMFTITHWLLLLAEEHDAPTELSG